MSVDSKRMLKLENEVKELKTYINKIVGSVKSDSSNAVLALQKSVGEINVYNKAVAVEAESKSKQLIKEIKNNTVVEKTIIQTDESLRPMILVIASRVKSLEDKKPLVQIVKELTTHEVKIDNTLNKVEISDIKKSIEAIKPITNNITQGLGGAEVLELIKNHVTMQYVTELYNK